MTKDCKYTQKKLFRYFKVIFKDSRKTKKNPQKSPKSIHDSALIESASKCLWFAVLKLSVVLAINNKHYQLIEKNNNYLVWNKSKEQRH